MHACTRVSGTPTRRPCRGTGHLCACMHTCVVPLPAGPVGVPVIYMSSVCMHVHVCGTPTRRSCRGTGHVCMHVHVCGTPTRRSCKGTGHLCACMCTCVMRARQEHLVHGCVPCACACVAPGGPGPGFRSALTPHEQAPLHACLYTQYKTSGQCLGGGG